MIPWGQVIEHAPVVLKGARRLMERQLGEAPSPEEAVAAMPPAEPGAPQDARIARLEAGLADAQARLAALGEQQRQGDELLAALAEQNTRLVEAVEVLRLRTRLLVGAVVVLAGGAAALAWRLFGG